MSGAGEGRFERLNITLGKLRLASTPVWRSPFALPSPGRSASCAGAVHPFLNVNYKTGEVTMRITDRLIQLRAVAVNVGGFVKRHKRASMAVAVALVIAAPLPTGTGGEKFFLNPVSSVGRAMVGLGIVALVVRRQ